METAGGPHASIFGSHASSHQPSSVLPYGIGFGLGVGATPQIAVAHGGRGGVGIRNSFPWVEAVPPFMQVPVKVLMLG